MWQQPHTPAAVSCLLVFYYGSVSLGKMEGFVGRMQREKVVGARGRSRSGLNMDSSHGVGVWVVTCLFWGVCKVAQSQQGLVTCIGSSKAISVPILVSFSSLPPSSSKPC